MPSSTLDVGSHAPCYVLRLLFGHLSHLLGRSADYEAAGRELASFGDECACSNNRTLAYPRSVQERGAHPDKTLVPDLAPMHDRVVADNTPLAHHRRIPRVRVQNAAVLDVRSRPYPDGLRISPQHSPVPDARLLPQIHRPDEIGSRRYEGGLRDLRPFVSVGEQVRVQDLRLHQHGIALAAAGADGREAPAAAPAP